MAAPRPDLGADPALAELRLDEVRKDVGRNFLQAHHRPGFVERTPRADHLFHQARFRPGEYVADLALLLCRGPQCVLDAAAVEAIDGLKLVEGHDDGSLLFGRQATR